MISNPIRTVGDISLTIAAVVTVVVMVRSAEGALDAGTVGFILWAVSPYICFFFAGRLAEKFLPGGYTRPIVMTIAVLMLVFTLLTYPGLLADPSSTAALAFIFIPLYLYIGGFALLVFSLGTSFLLAKRGE